MMNVMRIYGHENQFPHNKFMDNTIQFVHKTWVGVWVVIAISSIIHMSHNLLCTVEFEQINYLT